MRHNYAGLFFLLFIGCALFLHSTVQYHLVSIIPFFIIFPVVVTWVMRRPVGLLLVSGLLCEIFSTLPWGSMLLISLIPFGVKRIFPSISIDVALPFLLQLLLTICIQVSVLSFIIMLQAHTLQPLTTTIPFVLSIIIASISTLVAATLCIIWEQIRAVPS